MAEREERLRPVWRVCQLFCVRVCGTQRAVAEMSLNAIALGPDVSV